MTELTDMSYGDLLAMLRRDLQLDATTDLLPGTIFASLFDQNGHAPFLQLGASAKAQLAWGRYAVFNSIAAGANSTYTFTPADADALFGTHWTAIDAGIVIAWPLTTWAGFSTVGTGNTQATPGSIAFQVANGATAQNFDVYVLAIGH